MMSRKGSLELRGPVTRRSFLQTLALEGGSGTIGYLNRAAHPNAAKLFVNWWLSKEAQLLAMKQNPTDQWLREDIPHDDVLEEWRRQPGVQYIHLDSRPEYLGRDGEPNEFMKGVLENKR